MKRTFLFFSLFFLFTPLFAAMSPEQVRGRMMADLDHIRAVFEVKYAPSLWKKEKLGWDIEQSYQNAKREIMEMKEPSVKEFQRIVKRFMQTTKDYHVGALFYSTERSSLPFTVRGSEGHYYVVHTTKSRSIKLGDEILTMDGVSVDKVVEKIKKEELAENRADTDKALAEILLTHRYGKLGQRVPQGEAVLTVKRKATAKTEEVKLAWRYTKESIPDQKEPSKLALNSFLGSLFTKNAKSVDEVSSQKKFFGKMMVSPYAEMMQARENPYSISNRNGFLPDLGRKVWESDANNFFYAYIFESSPESSSAGKKIGFLRLAHYMGDSEEAMSLREIIKLFERETDALVIDQTNNGGGTLFFLYAVASTLSEKPLIVPQHHMNITQEEVYFAATLIPKLEAIQTDEEAINLLGDDLGGYTVDLNVAKKVLDYCRFCLSEWSAGRSYTSATPLYGIEAIEPDPEVCYSKPILVLVNELDFSAGDFFPAIMQDNKRATLFGTTTAGAGGCVEATAFPNQSGIDAISVTVSFGMRKEKLPLENLGVTPDFECKMTAKDYQSHFEDYVSSLTNAIDDLINDQEEE